MIRQVQTLVIPHGCSLFNLTGGSKPHHVTMINDAYHTWYLIIWYWLVEKEYHSWFGDCGTASRCVHQNLKYPRTGRIILVYPQHSTSSTLPPSKSRILLGCPLQYLPQLQRSGCVASCWARLSLLGDLVDLVEEDNAKCLSMLSKRFVIDPMALRRRPWFSVKTSDTDGQTPTNVLPSWRFLEMCTA